MFNGKHGLEPFNTGREIPNAGSSNSSIGIERVNVNLRINANNKAFILQKKKVIFEIL